jgi:hypothetical protein
MALPSTLSGVNANAFSKCSPAITSNIKQCGSVTVCNAIPPTADELATLYEKSGDFRVMEALFHHDFEIKMCEAVQNGLYDFFMANKVNVRKTMQTRRLPGGLIEIAPFVLARQYSPINNAYWEVFHGQPSGGNWLVHVVSSTNIPADVRSFPAGLRVWIKGKSAGGSAINSQYSVVSATFNAGPEAYVAIILKPQNAGSKLPNDKLGNPTQGILIRGTPNVSDFEKFCNEMPAYLNWKNVPFWVETTRNSMCKSSRYDKWRELVLSDNALYREFFDLDDIQKNKQIANDWQRRLVDQMFWGKALAGQDASNYESLDSIPAFDIATDWSGAELGIDVNAVDYGANCVAKRANAVGIYEQLVECSRVNDLQGAQLNLPALFTELYNMMRVREGNNHPAPRTFDIFTDSVTAKNINTAMLQYYNNESDGMARLNIDGNGFIAQNKMKKANFGFSYRSYDLFWPAGVTINIITHNYFDDALTAANQVGQADQSRVLWILDFTGIYPGILASNRVVHKTGDIKTLASINPSFACVMRVDTQEQTLTSVTWTMIVECPNSNLILESMSGSIPEPSNNSGNIVYGGGIGGTTTSTTTPA